ncbi:MAG: hypothetical protein IH989_01925 [Planctomycetes bacterium]|nr:hypothetical protein [Planctomycetota bacterium]
MATDKSGNVNRAGGKPGRRRLFFINPAFQWKYTLTIGLTVFCTTSVISTILYTVLHEQARMRVLQPHSYVANVTSVVLISAIVLSAVTAGALSFWCIIATHRICGPVFVLQRYMSQLAAGQIPTLRPLRKKDEFKELYAVCGRAVESLRVARRTELMLIGQARDALNQAGSGDDHERRNGLAMVATQLDMLQQAADCALGEEPEPKPVQSASGKTVTEEIEAAAV